MIKLIRKHPKTIVLALVLCLLRENIRAHCTAVPSKNESIVQREQRGIVIGPKFLKSTHIELTTNCQKDKTIERVYYRA